MKKTMFRAAVSFFLAVVLTILSLHAIPAEKTMAASPSYLFVGNSLTLNNNMPEVFHNIVRAGTGSEINLSIAGYFGRSLLIHSRAIAAVIRTKGVESSLTESEKLYFYNGTTAVYDSQVYQNYAALFWDYQKKGPKHYDYIILQKSSKNNDASASAMYNALANIIKAIGDSSTRYVVLVLSATYDSTTKALAAAQTTIDGYVSTAVKKVKNTSSLKGKYKNIKIAYAGRAICNYLYYTGSKVAAAREPGMFAVLSQYHTQEGFANDIFYGDCHHYTPLGTYLVAATIYSTIYGNAQWTTSYTGAR